MTQREAAAYFGVSHHEYADWELDRVDLPRGDVPRILKVSKSERFKLARRRAGTTVVELAEALGCSVPWLWQMETGRTDSTPLLKYWKRRRQL